MHFLCAQPAFDRPAKRSDNLLLSQGVYLKTEYSFDSAGSNHFIVPRLFESVFNGGHRVYNPNFWSSIPEFLQKDAFETIDTTVILRYMHAGWDTSYMIDPSGDLAEVTGYRPMDLEQISGLFFFES